MPCSLRPLQWIALRFPITIVLSIVCLATPAWADFQAGMDAYNHEDYATALREWRPLAEQGDAAAQVYLGTMYAMGLGVPQDYVKARQWYEKAAAQGDAKAQHGLALLYAMGLGVPQDYVKARQWYEKAAAQGIAQAQFNLGLLYAMGLGVPQDYLKARQWFEQAAAQGYAMAQTNLGALYQNGWGVPQDYAKARQWYEKAAAQGDAEAQYSLGVMYERGHGVPQDYVQAHMWYNLAAANGGKSASKFRDVLAEQMTPAQIAEAQKLAHEWKLTTGTAPAPQQETGKSEATASGTGFIISRQGHVLTNHHVVGGCTTIRATTEGRKKELTLVGADAENDLAVLQLPAPVSSMARFRDGRSIRSGDGVVVVGFPLHGLLSSEANVTTGTVSALAGIGNNTRFLQITAPVQPGNSGGPLLDQSGNIVGVVVSKLNALKLAKATGDIAQNINFAINGAVAKAFLDSYGVGYETGASTNKLEPAEIGAAAKKFTLLVECYR